MGLEPCQLADPEADLLCLIDIGANFRHVEFPHVDCQSIQSQNHRISIPAYNLLHIPPRNDKNSVMRYGLYGQYEQTGRNCHVKLRQRYKLFN